MLQNLPPRLRTYLIIGVVLVVAVLAMPPSKRDSTTGVGAPKPAAAAGARSREKVLLEAPCPVTSSQVLGWSKAAKARAPFRPLVKGAAPPPPAEPPEVPDVPQPLPLDPADTEARSDAAEPAEDEPTPDFLYTGWYKLGGQMVALVENLVESSFHYLREGESVGALTVVKIEPEEITVEIRGEEVRMSKTNEFVATPLNQNAPNSQTARSRFAGRFGGGFPGGFGSRFGGGGFPGGFGSRFGGGGFGDRFGGRSQYDRGGEDRGGEDRGDDTKDSGEADNGGNDRGGDDRGYSDRRGYSGRSSYRGYGR